MSATNGGEQGAAFDDQAYLRLRRELEEAAGVASFADYVTLTEVARITHSSYSAVYYALRAKVQLQAVKHGVQWFVLWKDAKEYAHVLRQRRLRKAEMMTNQAMRIEMRAAKRLDKARKLDEKSKGGTERSEPRRTKVEFGGYEDVRESIEPGDLPIADAARVTGYSSSSLGAYATPAYQLVRSYLVGGRRIIPASEVERLRNKRREHGRAKREEDNQREDRQA